MGVPVKHLPQWSQPAVGWHLAAWNCFVSAALSWWSLPPCPSEPRWRGMKSLCQAVLERGCWSVQCTLLTGKAGITTKTGGEGCDGAGSQQLAGAG